MINPVVSRVIPTISEAPSSPAAPLAAPAIKSPDASQVMHELAHVAQQGGQVSAQRQAFSQSAMSQDASQKAEAAPAAEDKGSLDDENSVAFKEEFQKLVNEMCQDMMYKTHERMMRSIKG